MSSSLPEYRNILLTGSNGMLARAVTELLPPGVELVGVDLPDFDMTDVEQVDAIVRNEKPDVIINCAAYTDVDGAEAIEDLATRVNGEAVGLLAKAAKVVGATLVHISTDYVFAGDASAPYREDAVTGPISAYGRSKLAGEQAVIESGLERYYIIRTSWLYGPGGKNFVETIIRLAKDREELRIIADQTGSPTFTKDLADGICNLLNKQADFGIYHFSNSGSCSWHGFAEEIIRLAKKEMGAVKVKEVVPIATEDYPLPAVRPAYSVFSKEKFINATGFEPPAWQDALARYFKVRDSLKEGRVDVRN